MCIGGSTKAHEAASVAHASMGKNERGLRLLRCGIKKAVPHERQIYTYKQKYVCTNMWLYRNALARIRLAFVYSSSHTSARHLCVGYTDAHADTAGSLEAKKRFIGRLLLRSLSSCKYCS